MPHRKIHQQALRHANGPWQAMLAALQAPHLVAVTEENRHSMEQLVEQCRTFCSRLPLQAALFLVDNRTMRGLFVSEQVEQLLGPIPARLQEQPLAWMRELLSPAEAAYIEMVTKDVLAVLASLPMAERPHGQVQYNLQVVLPGGRMLHLVEELRFPVWSADGHPLITAVTLHELGPLLCSELRTCRIHLGREGRRQLLFEKKYVLGGGEDLPLSRRELDILEGFSNGLSTREVASRFYVSENTVKSHRKNILRKVEVNSTAEAIKIALRNKWI